MALANPTDIAGGSLQAPNSIHAALGGDLLALACGPERLLAHGDQSPATELLGTSIGSGRPDPGAAHGMLLAVVDRGVLWWRPSPEAGSVAVVTANDEVHLLAPSKGYAVSTEPLSEGDRVVVVNEALREALADIEGALEMALIDDPSPSASCVWLLDAADGSQPSGTMAVAVVRCPVSA